MDQLHELEEFRLYAYENARLYKEKTKRWPDKHVVARHFEPGKIVLLFNTRLRLSLINLKLKWSGPFEVVRMTDHGAAELWNEGKKSMCIMNGQRVKHKFLARV